VTGSVKRNTAAVSGERGTPQSRLGGHHIWICGLHRQKECIIYIDLVEQERGSYEFVV
jgi:hypothetical protein